MSHPPLKALRVFEVVARNSSFRTAAEELCVSQSAVSHQIKHLEQWFGRSLFDLSGHRPQLLPHGEALAHALEAAFQNIDTACKLAQVGVGQRALVIAALASVAVG